MVSLNVPENVPVAQTTSGVLQIGWTNLKFPRHSRGIVRWDMEITHRRSAELCLHRDRFQEFVGTVLGGGGRSGELEGGRLRSRAPWTAHVADDAAQLLQ